MSQTHGSLIASVILELTVRPLHLEVLITSEPKFKPVEGVDGGQLRDSPYTSVASFLRGSR